MRELSRIPFHGQVIEATKDDNGTIFTALKPICENIGIEYSAQYRRLQRQPWAVVAMMATTGLDGKTYNMTCVDRRTLTMWLATIDTSRIKDDKARDLIILYQKEAADALDQYFNEGGAIRIDEGDDEKIILAKAIGIYQRTIIKKDHLIASQQKQLERTQPLALLGDAFVNTDGTMTFTQAARHLQTIDRHMTRDTIFGIMRGAGMLEQRSNAPTVKAVRQGLLKPITPKDKQGRVLGKQYARFTTKGLNWFIDRFIYQAHQNTLDGIGE